MRYFEIIGIVKTEIPAAREEKYIPLNTKSLAERHLKYLEDLFTYQKTRKQTIENKNSLLIGQASIVTSIVTLFIPLFSDQLSTFDTPSKILIVALFVFALAHYLLSIVFAVKNLEINKYQFAEGSTITVTKKHRATREIDFINEQIKDLVYCLNFNDRTNREIGGNLINAGLNFKIANITFFILTLLLVVVLSSRKKEDQNIKITNLSEIHCCNDKDTMFNQDGNIDNSISINNKIDIQSQKIDSLINKVNVLINIKTICPPLKKPHKPKPKVPCPCP